ncbi:tetratricopeptide repeat protein [Sphingopyxis sp. KK2]|uniref:tetratricopeptide repeat protein n=1 Tax=Sphingopyxis sp. KK2 TaxID=1855727 RepID=UPI0021192839|nr:SPOR domain-containing protein [Sphingopyxis sp. KK2]
MKSARPGRATHHALALSALLLAALPMAGVQAQVTPPDAATRAAMDKRTAARTLLSSALARIAANSNDGPALLDAGRASIELEDYRAALGFLTRAEQANPRDGAVKAALGSAMVHMENPTRALDYFGEAQLLGAPERIFLADRGLARDLLGQQDAAQRDYQLALSLAPNDETVRRYALSLGIAGEADRGVQLLSGQLRAQDRGAWRMRAMILAINGRNGEATEIVNATMPPQLAQNILPYLTQMDRLNPAQQAAAAHFGRFPSGNLGPPRKPVQVAAATPPPAATPPATKPAAKPERRPSERDRARGTLTPATATPPPVTVRRQPEPAATPPRQATTVAVASATPVRPAPTPTPTPAPRPTPPAASPPASVAATSTPPAAIASSAAPNPSAAPAPIGVAVRDGGPVGPGFSISDIGQPSTVTPAPAPSSSPAATTPQSVAVAAADAPPPTSAVAASPTFAPTPAAPLASLAEIVGSLEIPAEEMAASSDAVDAATLAKLREDKRKAEAAAEAKRVKDDAAAKAKAEADAKAKAEAAEKKANPARLWVQIATGANAKALALDYGKFAKKNAALFKGKSGGSTEWGRTRRLLVGPFPNKKAADTWLADYKKAGGDGFLFNSDAGQEVDPVK